MGFTNLLFGIAGAIILVLTALTIVFVGTSLETIQATVIGYGLLILSTTIKDDD